MESDKVANRDWVMPVQAINDDYRDTGFDRGHLNPNFMHCARYSLVIIVHLIVCSSCQLQY